MGDNPGGALSGRRALVVGGSAGIGRAVAQAWAAAGAEVVVCSRTEPGGPGAGALGWRPVDLTDARQARARLTELGSQPLSMVCFSAVHYGERRTRFAGIGEAEWRRQFEVNVAGLWLTLAATLPSLRDAAPGLLLAVSSEVAFNAGPGRAGYAASKAAAKALLDSVAREEDPARVRIVQILPEGMVDTPGIRRRRSDGFDYSAYMRPEAFARVAVHLAGAAGHGHHGDSLVVAGDGSWWPVEDRLPGSQSRPLPA
ncbi:SDR family NAD(P)-dependent oxidoreductase [Sphaerisporangium sp. TRM90804]|uniref:SDR family NAD(P)-dependent oxidoreductase n=1 Tax=Sphaerisporangium sp. TRM90804 TaxID=3031113 RepID=UPI002447EF1D|nr:SDR family NAD(P)-dependent oxidoreductase [Sphaerisporangium sp. TRM90804]MDH2427319.1 SDR family NAD(P)-dependent oxidoreductase [Sphaerisporangium sp. TRM90804]